MDDHREKSISLPHSVHNNKILYIPTHIWQNIIINLAYIKVKKFSVMSDSLQPHAWTVACQAPLTMRRIY